MVLGDMYTNGEDVNANTVRGCDYYREAGEPVLPRPSSKRGAEAGDIEAMDTVADWCQRRVGTE